MKTKLRIGIIGLISLIYGQAFSTTAAPNKYPEIYPGVEYGTNNDITKYDLILHFYPNSLYKLTYHYYDPRFPDQPEIFLLSTESYQKQNTTLIMHDKIFDFTWKIHLQEGGLMIKSGFQCMHDMFLTYYRTSNDKFNPNFIQDHQAQLDQVRKEKQPYVSVSKSYSWSYFKLYLETDRTYRLLHHNQEVISAGTWDRDGNILVLTDSALNMPFYGIIQPDGIKSMLLPGLYRGPIVLKRYF